MDKKFNGIICAILSILLLAVVIVLLYTIIQALLQGTIVVQFSTILILIVIILMIAFAIEKLCGGKKATNNPTVGGGNTGKPTAIQSNPDSSNQTFDSDSNVPSFDPSIQPALSEDGNSPIEYPNSVTNTDPSINPKPASSGKDFVKTKLPLFILIFVIIVYFIQSGTLPWFNSSPEGRWVLDRPENTMVDGVLNLTDYWYMDFYEDGTLDIGWKNVGSPEDSEGHGTWYQEGTVIYVTIYYDYGATNYSELSIRNNQLVDASTNQGTGYYRD